MHGSKYIIRFWLIFLGILPRSSVNYELFSNFPPLLIEEQQSQQTVLSKTQGSLVKKTQKTVKMELGATRVGNYTKEKMTKKERHGSTMN